MSAMIDQMISERKTTTFTAAAHCHRVANGDWVLCEIGKRLGQAVTDRLDDLIQGDAEMHYPNYRQAGLAFQAHIKNCGGIHEG
jgi:hypothetical protein